MDNFKSKKRGCSDILSRPFSSNEAVGGNNACSSSVTGDDVLGRMFLTLPRLNINEPESGQKHISAREHQLCCDVLSHRRNEHFYPNPA